VGHAEERLLAAIGGAIIVVIVSAYVNIAGLGRHIDWVGLSSGRLAEWPYRISLIANRSAFEILIGSGLGSDIIYSPTWGWEKMGSHNDFIRILYEQGIIGFLLMNAILMTVYRSGARNSVWRALWLIYIFSGLVSNGLMFRPTPTYIFALALASSQVIHSDPISSYRQPDHSRRPMRDYCLG